MQPEKPCIRITGYRTELLPAPQVLMRSLLCYISTILIALVWGGDTRAQTGHVLSVGTSVSALSTGTNEITNCVIDRASDRYYLVGHYSASGSSAELFDVDVTYEGLKDGFVAAYHTDGSLIWIRTINTSRHDVVTDVVILPDGGLAVSGSYGGELNLMTTHGPINSIARRGDAFAAKLTSDGQWEWFKTFGGGQNDIALSIDASSDRIYLGMGFEETMADGSPDRVYIEGRAVPAGLRSSSFGGSQMASFTAIALDFEGDYQWNAFFGGQISDINLDDDNYTSQRQLVKLDLMTVDDELVIAHNFALRSRVYNSDGSIALSDVNGLGDPDVNLLKYSSEGELIWRQFVSGQNNRPLGVSLATDCNGIYLATNMRGPDTRTNLPAQVPGSSWDWNYNTTTNGNNLMLYSFTEDGDQIWYNHIATGSTTDWNIQSTAMAADQRGNLFVTGQVTTDIFYDAGTCSSTTPGQLNNEGPANTLLAVIDTECGVITDISLETDQSPSHGPLISMGTAIDAFHDGLLFASQRHYQNGPADQPIGVPNAFHGYQENPFSNESVSCCIDVEEMAYITLDTMLVYLNDECEANISPWHEDHTPNSCKPVTYHYSDPSSGTEFDFNSTFSSVQSIPIEMTVTDEDGAIHTYSFIYSLVDTISPMIDMTVIDPLPVSDDDCMYTFEELTDFAPLTISDNCGDVSLRVQLLEQSTIIADTDIAPISGISLPTGTYELRYKAIDESANYTTMSQTFEVIDTSGPVISCPTGLVPIEVSDNCQGHFYDFFDADMASDACSGVADHWFTYADGSALPVDISSITTNLGTQQEFMLHVSDNAGNVSTCLYRFEIVDTTGPLLDCGPEPTFSLDPNSCEVDFGPSATVLSLPGVFDYCDIAQISYRIIGQGQDIEHFGNTIEGVSLGEGTYSLTWRALDNSGNWSSCEVALSIVDTDAPTISCAVPSEMSLDFDVCEVSLSGIALDVTDCQPITAASADYLIDGPGGYTSSGSGTANGVVLTQAGQYNITYTISDGLAANGTSMCSASFEIIDMRTPTIECGVDVVIEASIDSCGATVSNIAPTVMEDNCATQLDYELWLVGESTPLLSGSGQMPSVFLLVGDYTLTYTLSDASDNSSSCSRSISIQDVSPPTMSCPTADPVIIAAESYECGIVIEDYLFSIAPQDLHDACGVGEDDLAISIDGGSVLSYADFIQTTVGLGDHSIVYTLTDSNGLTADCSITLSVIDPMIAEVLCPSELTVEVSQDCQATITSSLSPTIQERCPDNPAPLVTSLSHRLELYVDNVWTDYLVADGELATPLTLSKGSYRLSYTLSSDDGQTSACVSTIDIVDTAAPHFDCPASHTLYMDDDGLVHLSDLTPYTVLQESCGPITAEYSEFSTDTIGIWPLTVTLTDASGLSASCQSMVTVTDTIAPQIDAVEQLNVYLDADGSATIAPSDLIYNTSDNDGIAAMTVSETFFDCADVGQSDLFVRLVLTDYSDNADSSWTQLTVLDTITPIIDCPESVTLFTTASSCEVQAVVSADISDNCTPPELFNSWSASESAVTTLGTGAHNLTWSAAGAQECQTTVEVIDTIAPAFLNCADLPPTCDTAGENVAWPLVESTDQCGDQLTVWPPIDQGHQLSLGQNELIWTVSDGYNERQCIAIIEVLNTASSAYAGPDIEVMLGEEVTMEASPASGSLTGAWSVIDGQAVLADSLDPTTTISGLMIGTNRLRWTITNETCQESVSDDVVITVKGFNIPSGFSPNDDGVNDDWHISGLGQYPDNDLIVYDRNGVTVYEAKGYTNDWNGHTDKGLLPIGTYFYILSVHDQISDGRTEMYKGYIEVKH